MIARTVSQVAVIAASISLAGVATAQPVPETRVVVAKSTSPAGTFAARPANGNQFRILADKDDIYSSDVIVSLPGGTLVSKNEAVTMKITGDFDGRSSLPIFETAFSLRNGDKVDFDLYLDRGRVDFTNTKSEGSATVQVRFWDETWNIVLDSPNCQVSVELCGRWPSGTRFKQVARNADPAAPAPVASLVLHVLRGSATVDVGGVALAIKAPPGPAELRWNSLTGTRRQPLKLEKLPPWADPAVEVPEEARKVAVAIEKFRELRATDPAKALDQFLASSDQIDQRLALVVLGGLDDLDSLGKTLADAKTLEQWDFGITVLRHWLGRSKGQEQRYYDILTSIRGYTDGQARIILQLLFGFSPEDLEQPETYEVLLDYLVHEKSSIRNLAVWHLIRLVPQGKQIAYKPDGSREDAERAYTEWKKLIPSGQLPQPIKKE
jgi:hypothetical protein